MSSKYIPLTITMGGHPPQILLVHCNSLQLQQLLALGTRIVLVVPDGEEAAALLDGLAADAPEADGRVVDAQLIQLLSMEIQELEGRLSVRTRNWCTTAGLIYVWQIVQMTEVDLMKIHRGFGQKTKAEIINALETMGLQLNMDIRELKSQLPKT